MSTYRRYDRAAVLCAFDLIEFDGKDLCRSPIEHRKRALAEVLGQNRDGIALNAHYECDGRVIFKHACKLGCEGYRVKAARLAVSLRPVGPLAQD